MPTCRDITEEDWEHVRKALITYFSRRRTYLTPEDLAQETILALLRRENYVFAEVEDFLRVAYGFAANILLWDWRRGKRYVATELDPLFPSTKHQTSGLVDSEIDVFLEEVLRAGENGLKPEQWRMVQEAAESNLANESYNFKPENANMLRVQLHRARNRLADITGWRKKAGRKKK